MSRIFETEQDRINQQGCMDYLETLGYKCEGTETLAFFDILLMDQDGTVKAVAEYKMRSSMWNPVYLDQLKVDHVMAAAREHDAIPMYIVETPRHKPRFVRLRADYNTTMFKRARGSEERNETPDKVACIPEDDFKYFGKRVDTTAE